MEAGFNESRSYPSPGHGYLHYNLIAAKGWPPSQPSPAIFGLPPAVFYSLLAAMVIIPAIVIFVRRRRAPLETPPELSNILRLIAGLGGPRN
jgi:hypothetical protein